MKYAANVILKNNTTTTTIVHGADTDDTDLHYNIDRKLTSTKARAMLHDHSWTTDRQRRYLGWVANGRSRSNQYGGGGGDAFFYRQVIELLNQRTRQATQQALTALENKYLTDDVDPRVGLEFSSCSDKKVSAVYPPFRTGYANAHRIHICSDTMTDAFNAIHSKQIEYDARYVSHYCVVFLHEFGHVMDKRHVPSFYGGTDKVELRADAWAQRFIDSAAYK